MPFFKDSDILMAQRIFLSFLFIPLLIIIIYTDFLKSFLLFVFVLALSVLASREVYSIANRIVHLSSGGGALLWFCTPSAVLILLYYSNLFFHRGYLRSPYIIGYIWCFLLIGINVYFMLKKVKRAFLYSLVYLMNYLYTGVFLLPILVLKQNYGALSVYFLFFLGWLNDAAAYFIGSFYGKTRNIVRYSPGKSVEGYLGGFLFTLGASFGWKALFFKKFPFGLSTTLFLGLIVALCAPLGDLAESMAKRKAGMKDSSQFLPGFGGVLDIFDSIIMSSPFYYLFILLSKGF